MLFLPPKNRRKKIDLTKRYKYYNTHPAHCQGRDDNLCKLFVNSTEPTLDITPDSLGIRKLLIPRMTRCISG